MAAAEVPAEGKHIDLTAPPDALQAIAARANARSVTGLSASFDLERKAIGLRVRGMVRADIEQTCVVTLEPLTNRIEEPIDVTFAEGLAEEAEEVALSADSDAVDPPEPLVNGVVDLASLAVEFLLLGVDPYPRKEGAEFETAVVGNPEIEPIPHPFAALAALKKPQGDENH